MNYINDNQVELELTEEQYEDIVKLLGLALSPKQVYAIHKEYSKGIHEEWSKTPDDPSSDVVYRNIAQLVLQNKTYQEIEDIWNGALL